MFERMISVDWSGAAEETDGVDLRVATYDELTQQRELLVRPFTNHRYASWTRETFRQWIVDQLGADAPTTLVAIDFGFGLPWNSDTAVFGVNGWHQMIANIGSRYAEHRTARATAQSINLEERFGGHGPFRFDDCRSDLQFYVQNNVSYYRIAELVLPQASSQWNLCDNRGAVGFHSITGMALLDKLIRERQQNKIDFVIWPHESRQTDGKRHCLAESYPAITPQLRCPACYHQFVLRRAQKRYQPRVCNNCGATGPWQDGHQEDAWKVLDMLIQRQNDNSIADLFHIPDIPFGRYENVPLQEQVMFEGWILGIVSEKQ